MAQSSIDKILSKNLNRGRCPGNTRKTLTDSKFYNLWRKCYPDTYKQIKRAMKEYALFKSKKK